MAAAPPRASWAKVAAGPSRPVSSGWLGLAFVLPSLAVFGAFLVLPVIAVAGISLLDWAGFRIGDWTFVGLSQFRHAMEDPVFWRSLTHTLLFTVATTVLLNITGFGYALLVASRVRGSSLAKSALFLPALLSPVIVALMWSRILDAFGAVNQLISLVQPTAKPTLFLGDPDLALASVIVATVWQFTGYNMLLYYAGLQNLPRDQLEAAAIDGTGVTASIRHIVLPSLYPVIGTAVLLNVIGGLRVFDLIYVMTRGGPNRSTEVLATYMYEQAFKFSDMGYASAIALVIVVLSVAAAVMRIRWGSRLHD
jgi:multiple sugar transport system permease protein/raffinose/stachyose/melibiose transport system permease protein